MEIYLDLVMGLNFLTDFLLILGTNRLSGFPPGWGRAALAAAVGGGYSGLCLLPGLRFLGNPLWRTVFLLLMGMTAFGWNPSALKRTGIFLLLSMAMGGLALAMGRRDFGMLILCALGVLVLCHVSFGGRIGGRAYLPIRIREGDAVAELTALRDTGNTLRDPVTGEQVLLIGPEYAKYLTGLTSAQLRAPLETIAIRPGYRLIPYRAVGQPGAMLLAKRFEEVRIGNWTGRALVAFAPEPIGNGEMYQALAGGMV